MLVFQIVFQGGENSKCDEQAFAEINMDVSISTWFLIIFHFIINPELRINLG